MIKKIFLISVFSILLTACSNIDETSLSEVQTALDNLKNYNSIEYTLSSRNFENDELMDETIEKMLENKSPLMLYTFREDLAEKIESYEGYLYIEGKTLDDPNISSKLLNVFSWEDVLSSPDNIISISKDGDIYTVKTSEKYNEIYKSDYIESVKHINELMLEAQKEQGASQNVLESIKQHGIAYVKTIETMKDLDITLSFTIVDGNVKNMTSELNCVFQNLVDGADPEEYVLGKQTTYLDILRFNDDNIENEIMDLYNKK